MLLAPRSCCVKAKPWSTRPGGFLLVLSHRLGSHPQTALLQLRAVSSLCVGFPLLFLAWWFGLFVWKPLQIPEPGCPRAAQPAGTARWLPGVTSRERGAQGGKGEPCGSEQAGSGCGRGCGAVGEPWGHFAALPGTDAAVSTGPSLARRQHLGCSAGTR